MFIVWEDEVSNVEYMKKVVLLFGYNVEDLVCILDGFNFGVSCGNLLIIVGLKEVSVV